MYYKILLVARFEDPNLINGFKKQDKGEKLTIKKFLKKNWTLKS